MITLYNLQGAVGDLSRAFSSISDVRHQTETVEADGQSSARTNERNVTDRMAGMAKMASRAFLISLAFISMALYCGISSTLLERGGRKAASDFEEWAVTFYQNSLPGQLPVTEGKVAKLLADSMAGMGEVIDELRAASGAFANLQPLVSSMSRATDSIEAAMRQLPEDLRSSMSNVTSDMVSQLNDTLGESAEYTKKILAIYAEQELRVKGLHSIVNSSQAALAEIKDTHKILEQLPGQMAHLSSSAASIAASNQEMSGKLGLFPTGALAEASVALVEGQSVLLASAEALQSAYVRLNSVLPNGHLTAADVKL
jgi:hypothetical protein